MSFERLGRNIIVFVCDVCGGDFEVHRPGGTHDYFDCWSEPKAEGWRIMRGEHYCGDCAELD